MTITCKGGYPRISVRVREAAQSVKLIVQVLRAPLGIPHGETIVDAVVGVLEGVFERNGESTPDRHVEERGR